MMSGRDFMDRGRVVRHCSTGVFAKQTPYYCKSPHIPLMRVSVFSKMLFLRTLIRTLRGAVQPAMHRLVGWVDFAGEEA